jgi:hypothetical protein
MVTGSPAASWAIAVGFTSRIEGEKSMEKFELLSELASVCEGKIGTASELAANSWWLTLAPEQKDQLMCEWNKYKAAVVSLWGIDVHSKLFDGWARAS